MKISLPAMMVKDCLTAHQNVFPACFVIFLSLTTVAAAAYQGQVQTSPADYTADVSLPFGHSQLTLSFPQHWDFRALEDEAKKLTKLLLTTRLPISLECLAQFYIALFMQTTTIGA